MKACPYDFYSLNSDKITKSLEENSLEMSIKQ